MSRVQRSQSTLLAVKSKRRFFFLSIASAKPFVHTNRMKFFEQQLDNSGKEQYVFILGKSEAFILGHLLDKGIRYMPTTPLTQSTEQRMRNMAKAIREALPKMKKSHPDDYTFLNEETIPRKRK